MHDFGTQDRGHEMERPAGGSAAVEPFAASFSLCFLCFGSRVLQLAKIATSP